MNTDKELFSPVTKVETVVYGADGCEIARLEGRVVVRPKDYAEQLPVEVRVVETTTQIVTIMRLEQ